MSVKKIVVAGVFLAFNGLAASAHQHGNEYVHSRAYQGQVYVMYQNHMSLYTFDRDQVGVSNCSGACAKAWPPAYLGKNTPLGESYGLIKRDDGGWQATFRGKPLYLFSKDKSVGDTNGDGVGGVWHLARP